LENVDNQQILRAIVSAFCSFDYAGAEQIGNRFVPYIDWHSRYAEYIPYYVVLARIAQNKGSSAKELASQAVYKLRVNEWPYPIMLFLNGELVANQLRDRAGKDKNRLTEALTFIGCTALYRGDWTEARIALGWVTENGNKSYFEYFIAQEESRRLNGTANRVPNPIMSGASVKADIIYRVKGVTAGDSLNVRKGPGADFGLAGTLSPSSGGITVLGEVSRNGDDIWVPIRAGRLEGWVNASFLEPDR
jgi:uncharacterized protein YgiM (DUF1202 family)